MLIKTKGPEAVKALRQALRSTDAVVRGTAATGLGALGAKEAVADLFGALDKNVGEAAASIGQLCAGSECDKLLERVGKQPFEIMSSGFDQLLFRPAAEVPDDQKIRVVGRLRELGTKEAGAFLADVAERWPKDWSAKVKQALDAAVRAVGGGALGSRRMNAGILLRLTLLAAPLLWGCGSGTANSHRAFGERLAKRPAARRSAESRSGWRQRRLPDAPAAAVGVGAARTRRHHVARFRALGSRRHAGRASRDRGQRGGRERRGRGLCARCRNRQTAVDDVAATAVRFAARATTARSPW